MLNLSFGVGNEHEGRAVIDSIVDAIITPEETRDTLAFLVEVSTEFTGPHIGAFALPSQT